MAAYRKAALALNWFKNKITNKQIKKAKNFAVFFILKEKPAHLF